MVRQAILSITIVVATLALSACATPARMHDEAQLNSIALGCGLALGELIQDESEKKLLLTMRSDPSLQQRVCVARWARRNGLKAVFLNIQFPEEPTT
jgi:hypothetical protein